MPEYKRSKDGQAPSFAMITAKRYKKLCYLLAMSNTVLAAFLFGVILYMLK
jgi:hypothetical protein